MVALFREDTRITISCIDIPKLAYAFLVESYQECAILKIQRIDYLYSFQEWWL